MHLHRKQSFLKTDGTAGQRAAGLHGKGVAFKNYFVLSAHQVRKHQRQAAGLGAALHGAFALGTLAAMKRRCVDDRQHLRASGLGLQGGRVKPGVLANQQANGHALRALAHMKHASPLAGREVTPLVKNLVVGQLLLGIGVQAAAVLQHVRCIEQPGHRDAARAQALHTLAVAGTTQHHDQPF